MHGYMLIGWKATGWKEQMKGSSPWMGEAWKNTKDYKKIAWEASRVAAVISLFLAFSFTSFQMYLNRNKQQQSPQGALSWEVKTLQNRENPQQSDEPCEEALCDSVKEKLLFTRKKPTAEPGSGRGADICCSKTHDTLWHMFIVCALNIVPNSENLKHINRITGNRTVLSS